VINILPTGPCDGFLTPAAQAQARAVQHFVLKP
jgi:hypothetical protein